LEGSGVHATKLRNLEMVILISQFAISSLVKVANCDLKDVGSFSIVLSSEADSAPV
jgi:hypothetical protein